jgi:hypothetical protein
VNGTPCNLRDLSWSDLALDGRARPRLGYTKIVFELEAKPEFG